jgi:hypothetical protein
MMFVHVSAISSNKYLIDQDFILSQALRCLTLTYNKYSSVACFDTPFGLSVMTVTSGCSSIALLKSNTLLVSPDPALALPRGIFFHQIAGKLFDNLLVGLRRLLALDREKEIGSYLP